MLSVEGRFLYPRRFLFHRGEILDGMNSAYVEGVFLGVLLLCAVYALIISACFSGQTCSCSGGSVLCRAVRSGSAVGAAGIFPVAASGPGCPWPESLLFAGTIPAALL